jgi:hypothetical protein
MTPTWSPPGPVAAAFLEAQDPIAVLMGPVGGGKTTVGLWKGVISSYLWPETEPGIRRVKFGVIRRLYKDLEKTTIPSWQRWFPRTMGTWRGAAGDPASHDLVLGHPSGRGRVELRVEFIATGDLRIEEALRGYEPSFIFIDEVDTAPENSLTFAYQRAGRFPSQTLARNPKMVWGALNAPEEGNWIVRDFIDEPLPNHRLYSQPSGLSPQAENLAILGEHYYRNLAETLPAFERKRFVENIPGLSRGAEAIYEEFNPDLHIAEKQLQAIPGRDLVVGMDAGGTPGGGILQVAPNGQLRVLAELSTHAKEHGSITGPHRFGEALAALLAERFRGFKVRGLADPSAAYGADTANGEGSWMEIVGAVAGFPVMPAPTNDPTIRREALRLPMTKLIDGRHPGLLVCPSCKLLKRALASDYRWTVTAGRRTGNTLKNWASHLVEGVQYGALDGGAYHEVLARSAATRGGRKPIIAPTDFNPLRG